MAGHPSPSLAPGPADRARWFLIDQWELPDSALVKLADATPAIVRAVRRELEAAGAIPARDPGLSDDAWTPRPPAAGERAQAELLADPARSNLIIADLADCHAETVIKARRELERLGAIPVVGRWQRRRRPGSGRGDQYAARTGRTDGGLERFTELPPQPASMAQGLCVSHADPDLWNSGLIPARRKQAIAICLTPCPALADCREWSLCLPTTEKFAVYGGLSSVARIRLRKQRERERAQAASAPA